MKLDTGIDAQRETNMADENPDLAIRDLSPEDIILNLMRWWYRDDGHIEAVIPIADLATAYQQERGLTGDETDDESFDRITDGSFAHAVRSLVASKWLAAWPTFEGPDGQPVPCLIFSSWLAKRFDVVLDGDGPDMHWRPRLTRKRHMRRRMGGTRTEADMGGTGSGYGVDGRGTSIDSPGRFLESLPDPNAAEPWEIAAEMELSDRLMADYLDQQRKDPKRRVNVDKLPRPSVFIGMGAAWPVGTTIVTDHHAVGVVAADGIEVCAACLGGRLKENAICVPCDRWGLDAIVPALRPHEILYGVEGKPGKNEGANGTGDGTTKGRAA
jgi:hypothetical protein